MHVPAAPLQIVHTHHREVWQRGYRSHLRGRARDDNPYRHRRSDSATRLAWDWGWRDGRDATATEDAAP